jgi:uncharacterized protein
MTLMTLPVSGNAALWLAVLFGAAFGFLLHRGRVTDYNVIVNQFRLKDFTVLKVMFTAIIVGGIGVLAMKHLGWAKYHVKPAELLGVTLGAAIFGAGMVIYGYCPGTGVAAVATGSVHALVGFAGMLVGGILYALSFTWVREHILTVSSLGKVRLPDVTGVPDWLWFVILLGVAALGLLLMEGRRRCGRRGPAEVSDPAQVRHEPPSGVQIKTNV